MIKMYISSPTSYLLHCGHKNSDVDNDHCASCLRKYSHNGNKERIQCSALCPQGINEQCF